MHYQGMKTKISALVLSAAAMVATAFPAQAQPVQAGLAGGMSEKFQALASTAHEEVGLALHEDDFTGTTIALPTKYVQPVGPTEVGYHWAGSELGDVNVETLRIVERDRTLESLYETLSAETPERKVTHAQLGDDWFVVTAEAGNMNMYMRVTASGQDLRGFSVSYDRELADKIEPAIAVMIGVFDPWREPAAGGEAQDYVAGLSGKRAF